MLIEFRVENHRSLRDEQVLTMEAGPGGDASDTRPRQVAGYSKRLLTTAGLYGANGSGKSNLLSALAFMRSAVLFSHRAWVPNGGVPRQAFGWGPKRTKPSLFETVFLVSGVRYQYGFVATDEKFIEEWLYAWPHGKKQTWFEREDDKRIKFGDQLHGENRLIEEVTRPNALFLSTALQHSHNQLQPVLDWFQSLQSVAVRNRGFFPIWRSWGRGTDRAIAELLDDNILSEPLPQTFFSEEEQDTFRSNFLGLLKAADIGIVDLKVITREDDDERGSPKSHRFLFQHQQGVDDAWLPLAEESEGTQKLFRIALPILQVIASGGILIVDELESSLHPALAQQIVRQFNNPSANPQNAQIIFTTHDTNLLGTIDGAPALRRDQIWFTEKDSMGATVLYPLTDYKPRKPENIERGYLQGRYGAIPFLSDFSIAGD